MRDRSRSTGRVAAVVLAAGSASRYGSTKALAALDGRPILQHVLDALAATGIDEAVVVLGDAAAEIERGIAWRDERRLLNPHPERGLASSLQVGLLALDGAVDGALIVLGDQPLLRPDVVRLLVEALARRHSTDRRPSLCRERDVEPGPPRPSRLAAGPGP